MRFHAATRYAIAAVCEIATHDQSHPVSGVLICNRTGTPYRYVIEILRVLSEKGIFVSFGGAQGGFKLLRPPDKITLLDIYEAVEGALEVKDPTPTEEVSTHLWSFYSTLAATLDGLTDLCLVASCQRHRRRPLSVTVADLKVNSQ